MLLPSTVGMPRAGWALTDALKLCRIQVIMSWPCQQQGKKDPPTQWFSPATTSKHGGSRQVNHSQSQPSPRTPVRSLPGKARLEEPCDHCPELHAQKPRKGE